MSLIIDTVQLRELHRLEPCLAVLLLPDENLPAGAVNVNPLVTPVYEFAVNGFGSAHL